MKRRDFIFTSAVSFPFFTFANKLSLMIPRGQSSAPLIVREGKNRHNNPMMKFMDVHNNDVLISKNDTDDGMSVFLFKGKKGASTSLHIHLYQDEFFHVIEGTYFFVCGDMREEVGGGETIFLPLNIPHQWLQLSETGSMIYAVTPAGTLEDMFVEFDYLKEPPFQELLGEIHSRHGIKKRWTGINVG